MSKANQSADTPDPDLCALHLRVGWCSLLVFVLFGLALEFGHGFKLGFYLDVSNETRRLMWTLSHAHGALLSIINIAFGISTRSMPEWTGSGRTLASRCHIASLALLPAGFFAGGLFVHGGDPGLGVLLVPPAGLVLVVAVFATARGAMTQTRGDC